MGVAAKVGAGQSLDTKSFRYLYLAPNPGWGGDLGQLQLQAGHGAAVVPGELWLVDVTPVLTSDWSRGSGSSTCGVTRAGARRGWRPGWRASPGPRGSSSTSPHPSQCRQTCKRCLTMFVCLSYSAIHNCRHFSWVAIQNQIKWSQMKNWRHIWATFEAKLLTKTVLIEFCQIMIMYCFIWNKCDVLWTLLICGRVLQALV